MTRAAGRLGRGERREPAEGVRADGVVVTTTNELTQLGKDRARFDSVDRIVGDERMPPFSAVTVRKPPQPGARQGP